MPVYEYECELHKVFELQHSIKDTVEECPKCKEEGLEPKKLKRLISSTNFALVGGGWAKEGYK